MLPWLRRPRYTEQFLTIIYMYVNFPGTELSSPYCCILLIPDLSEALSMPKAKEQFLRRDLSSGTSTPSLGLLIQHLKECTEGYFAALEAHQQHTKKLESRGKLSSDEMRQVYMYSTFHIVCIVVNKCSCYNYDFL